MSPTTGTATIDARMLTPHATSWGCFFACFSKGTVLCTGVFGHVLATSYMQYGKRLLTAHEQPSG